MTFHLVAPDPDFLARLTLPDAFAVPATRQCTTLAFTHCPRPAPTSEFIYLDEAMLMRNPYFHEWSHAAQPDGYPDQIIFRHAATEADELTAIEQGRADVGLDEVPAGTVKELQLGSPASCTPSPSDTWICWS